MKLPRIDLSRLQLSSLRGVPLHLTGRQRKIVRWAGMGLLAIASFLVTLKFTFPYDRLKGRLVDALSERYDVTVGDVGSGFLPGTVVFDDVILRSRPSAPGEKSSEILIDELVVDLGLDFGLLGALRKKAVFEIEADLVGGESGRHRASSRCGRRTSRPRRCAGQLPGVRRRRAADVGSLDADVERSARGSEERRGSPRDLACSSAGGDGGPR